MHAAYPEGLGQITVVVDADLEDLIPGYLGNRRRDVSGLLRALRTGDFETVRTLGHSMKGTGGGYGFDRITELGAGLEEAAVRRSATAVECYVAGLEEYLARVEVCYE